tara:strand:+ start:905 stop:1093 length:189 start_codon:yes stop_codon:yes gene_type:complete
MVVDVVAITSIALSGTAMLLQTLFTSRCSQIRCCGDGCILDREVMSESERKNLTKPTLNTTK